MIRPVACCVILGLATAPLGPLGAQQNSDAGGVWLRLSFDQILSATDNAGLAASSAGTTWQSDSRFSATLSSETRNDYVDLQFGGVLRWRDAPNPVDDVDMGFADPRLGLSYRRQVGGTRFSAEIAANQSDVTFLEPLDTVLEETGAVDLDTGTGTRTTATASAALRFGMEGPVEWGVSTSARQIRYSDTGNASFADSDRFDLRADAVLTLSPGLTFDGALSYRYFDEEGAALRETWGLDLGLTRALPRGSASLDLDLRQSETGTGATLTAGWAQPLPAGNLSFSLGLAQLETGAFGLTGRTSYTQRLKNGEITATLSSAYSSGSGGEETRRTQAQAGYGFALSPLSNLSINASYVTSETQPTGESAERASVAVGLSHALDRDWQLSATLRQSQSRSGFDPWAQSTGLSITLGRDFATRF